MARITGDEEVALDKVLNLINELGMADRFSVALVHKHFDMQDEEVLHEVNDKVGRISISRPIPKELLPEKAFPTQWGVGSGGKPSIFRWCCNGATGDGGGTGGGGGGGKKM